MSEMWLCDYLPDDVSSTWTVPHESGVNATHSGSWAPPQQPEHQPAWAQQEQTSWVALQQASCALDSSMQQQQASNASLKSLPQDSRVPLKPASWAPLHLVSLESVRCDYLPDDVGSRAAPHESGVNATHSGSWSPLPPPPQQQQTSWAPQQQTSLHSWAPPPQPPHQQQTLWAPPQQASWAPPQLGSLAQQQQDSWTLQQQASCASPLQLASWAPLQLASLGGDWGPGSRVSDDRGPGMGFHSAPHSGSWTPQQQLRSLGGTWGGGIGGSDDRDAGMGFNSTSYPAPHSALWAPQEQAAAHRAPPQLASIHCDSGRGTHRGLDNSGVVGFVMQDAGRARGERRPQDALAMPGAAATHHAHPLHNEEETEGARRKRRCSKGPPEEDEPHNRFKTQATPDATSSASTRQAADAAKNKNCHYCEHAPKRTAFFACTACEQTFCETCNSRHLGKPTLFKGQADANRAAWRCPICTQKCCCTLDRCGRDHLHCKRYRRRLKTATSTLAETLSRCVAQHTSRGPV